MRARLAAPLALLVAAGCAGFGDGEAPSPVTRGELGTMVVPQTELGGEFAGLELHASDSGPETAGDAADGTIDPHDTAGSLKRAGWLQGYELGFFDQRVLASSRRKGLVEVSTSVDLFADESSARAIVLNEVRAANGLHGKKRGRAKYVSVEEYDPDIGGEAWGLEVTARVGSSKTHATAILFRRGRIVGSAGVLRTDDTTVRTAVARIAQALDSRIERVLAGELHVKSPVSSEGTGTAKKGRDSAKSVPTRSRGRRPREHLIARDMAIARKAVVHPANLKPPWQPAPVSHARGPGCPAASDANLARFTITGKAQSAFKIEKTSRINSRVTLFANAGQAASYFEATSNRTVLRCIRDGIMRELRETRFAPELLFARFKTEPPIGSRTTIYVLDYVLTLPNGTRQEYPVEVLTFQSGRAVGAISFAFVAAKEDELGLARFVASRLSRT